MRIQRLASIAAGVLTFVAVPVSASTYAAYTAEFSGFGASSNWVEGWFGGSDFDGNGILEGGELTDFVGSMTIGYGSRISSTFDIVYPAGLSVSLFAPRLEDVEFVGFEGVPFDVCIPWLNHYNPFDCVFFGLEDEVSHVRPHAAFGDFDLTWSSTVADIPQNPLPATLPMILAGIGALGFVARRRARNGIVAQG